MNPWWKKFCDALADAHDETCFMGSGCPERHRHIAEDYMAVAVKEFFDTKPDLQGELIKSAKELGL